MVWPPPPPPEPPALDPELPTALSKDFRGEELGSDESGRDRGDTECSGWLRWGVFSKGVLSRPVKLALLIFLTGVDRLSIVWLWLPFMLSLPISLENQSTSRLEGQESRISGFLPSWYIRFFSGLYGFFIRHVRKWSGRSGKFSLVRNVVFKSYYRSFWASIEQIDSYPFSAPGH